MITEKFTQHHANMTYKSLDSSLKKLEKKILKVSIKAKEIEQKAALLNAWVADKELEFLNLRNAAAKALNTKV